MTNQDEKPSRPTGVTILIIMVLIIGGMNLTRFVQSVKLWDLLIERLPFSPIYLILTGLIWGGIAIGLAWGLYRGEKWAYKSMYLFSVVYVLYQWSDRLFFQDPTSRPPNTIFKLAITFIFLGLVYWILFRHNVKEFFGEPYEQ